MNYELIKDMKKLLTAAMLIASGAMATAQTQVTEYRPGMTAEGVVYYLPKTTVKVAVKVEKTTYTPGEFCKYADKYLRLSNVQEDSYNTYRLIDTKIWSYGEADKQKAFAVKVNAKTAVCNLKLADDGRLLAVNADAPAEKPLPQPFEAAKKEAPANPRSFLSQEILAAGSVTKMAELTASEIYDIRESRNSLTRGEADFMPKDGEQLRLMLSSLDQQDKALSSMFSGTVSKDTIEMVFTITPDKEINKKVLFRMSEKLGLLDKDDMAGAPYYLSVKDLQTLPKQQVLDEKAQKAKEKAEQAAKEKGNVLYVNVPSKILVTIAAGNNKVAEYETTAGQFGRVELLSGDLFNKRFTTHLTLDPQSGAVDKLTAEEPK